MDCRPEVMGTSNLKARGPVKDVRNKRLPYVVFNRIAC